jgi:hypothetical protein
VVSMAYDLVTMGIATFYLMRGWSGAWRYGLSCT